MGQNLTMHTTIFRHEQLSALLVVALTAVALLTGWGVKNTIANQTDAFTDKGVSAAIPAGWWQQQTAGDLILNVRNPQSLNQRYTINLLPADMELAAVAARHSNSRSRLTTAYRILETTPIVVQGHGDGYKLTYAYVDAPENGLPTVIEGVSYYFPGGDKVLVISAEADHQAFVDLQPQFQRFLTSVIYQPGG